MRYSVILIVAALTCLLCGEAFGIWMSQDQQRFVLHPVHAHANLAGWATLCLYGLVHANFPALAATKLAPFQCGAAILGAFIMPVGIYIAMTTENHEESVVMTGALLVAAGTILMTVMVVGKLLLAKSAAAAPKAAVA